MAQDNEYVQKLIAARDREVAHRRDVAEALVEKHNRGDTENMREASALCPSWFVHLSDGSSFHPVQVVAPNTLPNYADEVLKLTTGCAILTDAAAGQFALNREIPVCVRLRGGAGRTRTSNQTIISRQL
jgi:hypothetical protein